MPKVAELWLQKILDSIYQRRTFTRSQVIAATKLSPAAVSHTLRLLLHRGTILKVGELHSNAGRRRDVLTLNSEAGYFVAVDLEGTRMRFALTNFVGDIRYRWEEGVQFGQTLRIEDVAAGIQMVLRNLTDTQRSRLVAIGISCPGIFSKSGEVTAFNLGWNEFPLALELKSVLNRPVYLENPLHSAILAERWVGSAQGVRNFIYVMVGHGVGVGIFSNGRFVGGRDQMAGEAGHIRIAPESGDACRCGRTGCLESIISSPNIARQYMEKKGLQNTGLTVVDVFERARRGDPVATEVLGRATRYLGLTLSYLINFLNPEMIILGGDLVNAEDLLLPRIRREIEENALPHLVTKLNVAVSRMGLDIGLKGAASLAFRMSLNDPETLKEMCRPVIELPAHSQLKTSEPAGGA